MRAGACILCRTAVLRGALKMSWAFRQQRRSHFRRQYQPFLITPRDNMPIHSLVSLGPDYLCTGCNGGFLPRSLKQRVMAPTFAVSRCITGFGPLSAKAGLELVARVGLGWPVVHSTGPFDVRLRKMKCIEFSGPLLGQETKVVPWYTCFCPDYLGDHQEWSQDE